MAHYVKALRSDCVWPAGLAEGDTKRLTTRCELIPELVAGLDLEGCLHKPADTNI